MKPNASIVLILAVVLASAAPAGATFSPLPRFGTGSTVTIAWCDYDRDGDLDVTVGNTGGTNELFRNDGGAVFTRSTPFGSGATFAIAWADFDNDGDPDLAVGRSGDQGNRLYVNNGDGTFTLRNEFGTSRTIALAWADYDRDGDLDLAEGNGILGTARQNMLYVNNGGVFTGQAQFGISQTDALAWGDFDQDGDPDLAVANGGFTGIPLQNYLYVSNGDGTFTARPEFGTGDTASLAWGDADNDGDLDMAVGNWENGRCYLYVNNGGTFTETMQFGDRDTNTISWGEADNDGDLDVALGNGDFSSADSSMLYVNGGALSFAEQAQFGLASTDAIAWGDYDIDGDLDAAVGNEHSPSQNYLFVNNENDADYLSLHLAGRFHALGAGYSNRDGIGAKVYAYRAGHLGDAAHLLGFREIEAHGGFAPQSSIDAHFGLPGQATVDVRIIWPGSAGRRLVQDLAGVTLPQRLTVTEAGVFTDVAERPATAGPARLTVTPNPTTGEARFEFAGTESMPGIVALDIWDTTGRLVRSLTASGGAPARTLRWDGRSDDGRPAPPGVYFGRASSLDGDGQPVESGITRLVLLR